MGQVYNSAKLYPRCLLYDHTNCTNKLYPPISIFTHTELEKRTQIGIYRDMVMIVNTFVDKKAAVMIRTVTGEITFEEIKSSYEASLTHPDFQRDMHAIWDIRDADASEFDSQDVIRIARYFETQIKNRAEYKVAVIVSRDLEYGLSKIK